MADVIVSGRVVANAGDRALVPAAIDPQSRADCAITLEGTDLPPLDCNASARGELVAQRLRVVEWNFEPDPHPAWTPCPDLPGVEPEVSSRAVDTIPAAESDYVSFGETKLADGQRTAMVQLVRVAPRVSAWLADQPPGSVYVYPFIRAAGTPSVWTAGENHLAPRH